MEYKSTKLTEEAHTKIKQYCKENYLKMSEWMSSVLLNHIKIIEEKKCERKD